MRERERNNKKKAQKKNKRYCCTSYKFDTKRQRHQQTVYSHQLTDDRGDVGFRVSGGSAVLLHELRVECVCVCVLFPFILEASSSSDVPAGVAQEEGHAGFFIYLPSAVRALIFLARRIQPFLFLVDREVEFLCTNDLIVFHSLGIYIYIYLVRKFPFTGIELTSQIIRRLRGYL